MSNIQKPKLLLDVSENLALSVTAGDALVPLGILPERGTKVIGHGGAALEVEFYTEFGWRIIVPISDVPEYFIQAIKEAGIPGLW